MLQKIIDRVTMALQMLILAACPKIAKVLNGGHTVMNQWKEPCPG